jgi:hypothetical protein
MSQMKYPMPFDFGAAASVRASKMPQRANCA